MADMTEAQASQSLRAAIAGMKYLTRLDEALTAALAADKRLVSAQKAAADSENLMASMQAEIAALKLERDGLAGKVEDERTAYRAAKAERAREEDAIQRAVLNGQIAVDKATQEAQGALLDVRRKIAAAEAELVNAKAALAAHHAAVAALAQ